MPPKAKISREEIVLGAIELIRCGNGNNFNARSLAKFLNCSTQPIFSNFSSISELNEEVLVRVYKLYLDFIKAEVESEKYPKYKAYGMAYVRFAKEQKELFKLLFMRDRKGEEWKYTVDFNESVEMIMKLNNVSRDKAKIIHFENWICVHGIATMIATSFLTFSYEEISDMITDLYQGIRARHVLGDK